MDELKSAFAAKAQVLIAKLETWFKDEVAAIDGEVAAEAPYGSGGSIMGMRPAIDSKRVLDATAITKEVLNMELPPEIIKPGGYGSCDEMIADLMPKLEQVFTGAIKVKKPKPAKEFEPV